MNKSVKRQMGLQLGEPLTRGEIETLRAVMSGHTVRADLAKVLNLSRCGVNVRLSNIYAKPGADTLADVVLMVFGKKSSAIDLSSFE